MEQAIAHRGFSLVDILHPCVCFNKTKTSAWYKERCQELSSGYDPGNFEVAMKMATEWGERTFVGVIYREDKTLFEEQFAALA